MIQINYKVTTTVQTCMSMDSMVTQ